MLRPLLTRLQNGRPKAGGTGAATGLNILGQGLPAALALFTIPVLVRGLGGSSYGLFALAWSITGYFSILDLGISRAASRAVAVSNEGGKSGDAIAALAVALRTQLLVGIVAAIGLALAAPALLPLLRMPAEAAVEGTAALRWLALGLPFTLVAAVLNGALEGLRRFATLNVLRVVTNSLLLLAPVCAVWAGGGVAAAIAALSVGRVLGVGLAAFTLRDTIRNAPPSSGSVSVGALYRYGGWITVSGIATQLLTQSDRFVIGRLLGLPAVSAYTAPLDVISRISIVPASVVSALFPRFAALFAAGDEAGVLRLVAVWSLRMALLLGAIVALCIPLAPELLRMWLGAEIGGAAAVPAQLLLIAALINGVAWVPAAYFHAVGRPDLPALSHLLQLPLYAVAVIALTARFGLVGAACAAIGRATIDTVGLYLLLFTRMRQRS